MPPDGGRHLLNIVFDLKLVPVLGVRFPASSILSRAPGMHLGQRATMVIRPNRLSA